MSKYKILVKISGSIAAYKSAYLISRLVQSGFEVQTVATESALKFIGKATLEGLTRRKVITDSFEDGEMMSHINLAKWADLTIFVPATGNTINKMSAGIADNIITSLFLAHNWEKPYLLAPAMNSNMFAHPATQNSLKKLEEWGVKVLPTEDGYLACGDTGKGKLLDPDKIFNYITETLNDINADKNRQLNILVTAGGTREKIDGVRYLTNMSTGNTASELADYFRSHGHNVTFLHADNSILPKSHVKKDSFSDFNSLFEKLIDKVSNNDYDGVIHMAAVSDFSLGSVSINNVEYKVPIEKKIPSGADEISFNLKANFKIVNKLKENFKNRNATLVSFKFTNSPDKGERIQKVIKLMDDSQSDFVVLNDLSDRVANKQQNFKIFFDHESYFSAESSIELARQLEIEIFKKKMEREGL